MCSPPPPHASAQGPLLLHSPARQVSERVRNHAYTRILGTTVTRCQVIETIKSQSHPLLMALTQRRTSWMRAHNIHSFSIWNSYVGRLLWVQEKLRQKGQGGRTYHTKQCKLTCIARRANTCGSLTEQKRWENVQRLLRVRGSQGKLLSQIPQGDRTRGQET